METYIGLALAVTMIQLLGAWLRYLPFKGELSVLTEKFIWRCFAVVAVLQTAAYIVLFTAKGLNVFTYKLVMYTGFLLYVIVSVYLIRQRLLQHLFVISMQLMWALFIHAASNTLTSELPLPITGVQQYLALHTVFYLMVFALTLPLARHFFRNLLPPAYLFAEKRTGYYMALLPLGLGLSHMMLLADDRIVYNWNDHLSRLMLSLWVFLFYRFMVILVRRTEEQDRKENSYLMMNQRINALEDYTRLTWERQEEIMRIRHDLRHYNRLLLSLIESGETKKAADLIIAQEGEILAASLPTYCQNPIINAALGVYVQRAQEQGIPVTHTVKLPPQLTGDPAVQRAGKRHHRQHAAVGRPARAERVPAIPPAAVYPVRGKPLRYAAGFWGRRASYYGRKRTRAGHGFPERLLPQVRGGNRFPSAGRMGAGAHVLGGYVTR